MIGYSTPMWIRGRLYSAALASCFDVLKSIGKTISHQLQSSNSTEEGTFMLSAFANY
jgi:hypothetical protein